MTPAFPGGEAAPDHEVAGGPAKVTGPGGAPGARVGRREALKRLGALVCLPALAASAAPAVRPRPDRLGPLGVQLYTLRAEMARDLPGTLARVAEIGYEEVEFAGYFGHPPTAIRRFLDAAGLRAPAAHVGPDRLGEAWPETLEAAAVAGHDYLVVPGVPEPWRASLDAWRRTAERFDQAAEEAREAGIGLAYHNHAVEFREMEGRTPMDVFLEAADPDLVKVELDLFWIVHGGGDPIAFIDRWPGRIPMVHVKDRTREGKMVDVGAGDIDWRGIFRHRDRAGIRHYFVEHDAPGDPFGSVAESHRYLADLEL